MFRINHSTIDNIIRAPHSKTTNAKDNQPTFDMLKLTFSNLIEFMVQSKTYHAGQWINYIDRWLRNNAHNNTATYKRGEIIFLDLGAQNFAHEPSYCHACIVLKNRYNSILVVPCSSKKIW